MKTKIILVSIAISILAIICIACFCVPKLYVIVSERLNTTSVPKPKITRGEFPFELKYELDGETISVNDVYVCEYDGIGKNEGVGKYIRWKGYIKGTGSNSVLIKEVNNKKIFCSVGWPEYYMNDPNNYIASKPEPELYIEEKTETGLFNTYNIDGSEFNIKIISYQFSEPIENLFE